jgi:hypothetical protein
LMWCLGKARRHARDPAADAGQGRDANPGGVV